MTEEPISSKEFRLEVDAAAASIFQSHGFHRASKFDTESPTTASVVYCGKNLAFTFTLDIRDQAIDLIVTRYRGGKLLANWDGGYSSSVFTHLLNHCGFRGRPTPPAALPATSSRAQKMIASHLNLLVHPASAALLSDTMDALPR
jgi:hypothetical protein